MQTAPFLIVYTVERENPSRVSHTLICLARDVNNARS